jgi:hypothetical protein
MNYIKTWKEVILKPAEFFMKMPTSGGYADPLTFAAISYIISWFLSLLVFFSVLTMEDSGFSFSEFGRISMIVGVGLLLVFVSLLILSLIANLLYRALGGIGSYEGTLRFASYASAALIFLAVPYVVSVTVIYEMYLLIIGGMVVHNVSMRKSIIAVFLSFFLPTTVWTLVILFGFV